MRARVLCALIVIASLSGCAATPSRSAVETPSSTIPARMLWTDAPEFAACVAMYDSMPEYTATKPGLDAHTACSLLAKNNSVSDLRAGFGDPSWVEQFRLEKLAEVAPIEPRYDLSFAGVGDATVTWTTQSGMIQRHVTLPYSESVQVDQYVTSNVVQIPAASGGVGCKITAFSNQHRDGALIVEVPPVEGQTMAVCTPPR